MASWNLGKQRMLKSCRPAEPAEPGGSGGLLSIRQWPLLPFSASQGKLLCNCTQVLDKDHLSVFFEHFLIYTKDTPFHCRRSGFLSKLQPLVTHTTLPILGLSFLLWKMRELGWMFSKVCFSTDSLWLSVCLLAHKYLAHKYLVIKTRSNLRAESFPLNIPKAQPYTTDILDAQKDLLTIISIFSVCWHCQTHYIWYLDMVLY